MEKIDKKVKSNKYNKVVIAFLSSLLIFLIIAIIVLIIFSKGTYGKIRDNELDKRNEEIILDCIVNKLNDSIFSENNLSKEISLNTFTNKDSKIDFYKALENNQDSMYAMVKTYDYEVIRDFDLYFSSGYDIYQTYTFLDNVYIYVYSKNNKINFDDLGVCNNSEFDLGEKDIKSINKKVVQKLNDTNKIIIKSGNKKLGIIKNESVIDEILNIITNSKRYGNNFLLDAHQFEFEMYDELNNVIDTIYIWNDGVRLNLKSIGGGYYFTDNLDLRELIERETNYIFYNLYNLTDSCKELELIYEDDKYNYYLNCKEYGTMLIKFDLTNMKMKIKYSLDNNFITISHLSLYDNMILKIEK